MRKWVIALIVICAIILTVMSGMIKFSVKKDSYAKEPEEFNAQLTIEDTLPYCYSSDKCIFDYVTGKVENNGSKVIRSGQITYRLFNKGTEEKIAEHLDPIPSGLEGDISANKSRQFISKKVFIIRAMPQGEYTLEVEIMDSLTGKVVATKRKEVNLKQLTAEELLEETDKLLNK